MKTRFQLYHVAICTGRLGRAAAREKHFVIIYIDMLLENQSLNLRRQPDGPKSAYCLRHESHCLPVTPVLQIQWPLISFLQVVLDTVPVELQLQA